MPVARIVTRFAEEAAPLISRLRARGYTIEVVDPGTFRVTPADLEIVLDRLTTPEALLGAARFARERDAEVFVAAGLPLDEETARALREGAMVRRHAIVEGFKKLIAPLRRLGAEVHDSRKARRQQRIDLELAREAERTQRAEKKAAERAERARREQEEREARGAREREEREARIVREREEEDRRRSERAASLARQREEAARSAADREAESAGHRRAEEAERQRREAEAARLSAEEAERRRVADEVVRAESERRLEEECQRAVAGAAALVEARRREAEMRRLAAGAPASRRQGRQHPAAAVHEAAASRAMKRGMVAAACVAVLVAIGWGAYQNRMPAQPLSNQQRVHGADIQQDVPFGAATIKPKPSAKPQQQPKTAQQKTAPASAPKASPKRAHRYAADDANMVAEDEIVYHGAPKNSKSRASAQTPAQQQQNGVKRISDLDGENQ